MRKVLQKFLLLTILFTFVFSFINFVNADNDNTQNMQNITKENVFKFSQQNVLIDNPIDGDVFICCTGTVTISTTISGNVYICANNVEISQNSNISNSLYVVARSLELNGSIEQNAYICVQDFTQSNDSFIGLDSYVLSQNTNIFGYIYRNAFISSTNINLGDTALIFGNLDYSSENEKTISKENVYGNIKFTQKENEIDKEYTNSLNEEISNLVFSCISFFVMTIFLLFIIKIIAPRFIINKDTFKSNLYKYFIYGIIGILIAPCLSIVLLIPGITSRLALVIVVLYLLLLLVSESMFCISLSNIILDIYSERIKTNKKSPQILAILAISTIYTILKLIPVIGVITRLIVVILGFGFTLRTLLPQEIKE